MNWLSSPRTIKIDQVEIPLDRAMTANRWLEPGAYRLEVKDEAASGLAQFIVGEREGPPVRIVLR